MHIHTYIARIFIANIKLITYNYISCMHMYGTAHLQRNEYTHVTYKHIACNSCVLAKICAEQVL